MFTPHHSDPPPKPSRSKPGHHQPASAPPPMPTFTTIIDQDHDAINDAAMHLSRLLRTPLPATQPQQLALRRSQLAALHTLTWRLIRHDLSEELIMRPAFIRHLGPQAGAEAADHDRRDHEHARLVLLDLYRGFLACPPSDTDTAARLTARFAALMRELAEHMRRESGEEMPSLERRLGRVESEELGRRYAETLVVEPALVLGGRRVFQGGVPEFVEAGKERLLAVWGEVVRERDRERERRRRNGRL